MTNKEFLKIEIGKRVKEIRENKMHMTKQQFAKLIGMQGQYLGTVESGKRGLTIEKAIEICNKTDVSADYLLCGTKCSLKNLSKKTLSKYSYEEIYKSFDIMKDLVSLLK